MDNKYKVVESGCCTAFVERIYIVIASSPEEAKEKIGNGIYDSKDEIVDIDDDYSSIKSIEEVNE